MNGPEGSTTPACAAADARLAVVFDCLFPISTGGGERLYRAFAESFAQAGHRVDYLTRLQWDGRPPSMGGVAVHAVSGRRDLYDDVGTRKLVPALVFACGLFWHLVRRRNTYDAVLVSATPLLNVFAARLALLGTNTRLCVDFLEVWRTQQWIEYSGPVVGRVVAVLQRIAIRCSPLISCHSQITVRRLRAEGLRTEPVLSPGLLNDIVDVEVNLEMHEPPTAVYVGRHIPDKQVETIPAAIGWARHELPDLRATILGDGQSREAVRAEIRRCGLEDVIDLPGFVAEETLKSTVRNAAVLVHPSKREGYGLVVVEACAAGTPVVVIDAEDNAATELVEPGVNGFTAPSAAAKDLGAAIVAVVRGGSPLRLTARTWFEVAAKEKTMEAAASQILKRLVAPA